MKILMLSWEMPPPYHTGGMGVVSYQIGRELRKESVHVEMAVPFAADFSEAEFPIHSPDDAPHVDKDRIEIYGGYYSSQEAPAAFHAHQEKYIQAVCSLVETKQYDAIHAHDWLTATAALYAQKHYGIPVIAHVHSTEFDRAGGTTGNQWIHKIEYQLLKNADHVVAVSQKTKDDLVEQYALDPSRITVVYNFLDMSMYSKIIDDTDMKDPYEYVRFMKDRGYKVILSAGRLTVQKGLRYILESSAHVMARRPDTFLIMMGGGDQLEELIELSAHYGIADRTLFTDTVNGMGIRWRDAFRLADVFVMPSVSEPFGITPFEAIAADTPVVISRQSGVSEVLPHAMKTDYWDTHKMSNYIYGLLEYEELHAASLQGTKDHFKTLSWKQSINRLKASYGAAKLQRTAAEGATV